MTKEPEPTTGSSDIDPKLEASRTFARQLALKGQRVVEISPDGVVIKYEGHGGYTMRHFEPTPHIKIASDTDTE